MRSPEVLTRPRSSAQGSQTFGFPPYAIVGRDDHLDWLSTSSPKPQHTRWLGNGVPVIAAALVPPPSLETRQRVAADRAVTESLVGSYLDAVKRKLSKREQRQRLSALVPTIGQHGYTLPMLKRELNINISRCAARARLC